MNEEDDNCYISDHVVSDRVLSQNMSEEIEIKEDITSGRNSSQNPVVNIDDDNTIPDLRINRQKSRESIPVINNRDANGSGSPARPDDRHKILKQSRQKQSQDLDSSKYININNEEEKKEEPVKYMNFMQSEVKEQQQPFAIAADTKKPKSKMGRKRNSKMHELSSNDSAFINFHEQRSSATTQQSQVIRRLNFTTQDSKVGMSSNQISQNEDQVIGSDNVAQEMNFTQPITNSDMIEPFRNSQNQPFYSGGGEVFNNNNGAIVGGEIPQTPENIINVHQHFNQPNIMNFNGEKQTQKKRQGSQKIAAFGRRGSSAYSRNQGVLFGKPSKKQDEKRIKSAYPKTQSSQVKYQSQRKLTPSSNFARSRQVGIQSNMVMNQDQLSNQDYLILDANKPDQGSIVTDVEGQLVQMPNSRPLSQQHMMPTQTKSPVRTNHLIYTSNIGGLGSRNHSPKRRSQKAMILQSYKNLPNVQSSLKRIKENKFYKKEDIYDSMINLKLEVNQLNDENLKQKTKIAQLIDQIKYKDKFIGDLLKSTYQLSLAVENRSPIITTTENHPSLFQHIRNERKDNKQIKNLFKDFQGGDKQAEDIKQLKQLNIDLQQELYNVQCENNILAESPSDAEMKEKQNHIDYLYKKEAQMREVSELAIITLIQNGLVKQVNSQPILKTFAQTINLTNLLDQQTPSDVFSRKSSSPNQNKQEMNKLNDQISQLQQKLESTGSQLTISVNENRSLNDQIIKSNELINQIEQDKEAKDNKINELNQYIDQQNKLLSINNKQSPQLDQNSQDELILLQNKLIAETKKNQETKETIFQQQQEIQKIMTVNQSQTDKFLKINGQLDDAHQQVIKKNQDYIQLQQEFQKLQQENQQKSYENQATNQKLKKLQSHYDMSISSNKNMAENFSANIQKLNRQISMSQESNIQLKEEINYIQERLMSVNIEDVDERSDLVSHLSNILEREISVKSNNKLQSPGLRKQVTSKGNRKSLLVQDVILEENDDLDQTIPESNKENTAVNKLQAKINDSQIKEKRKSMLNGFIRSHTHFEKKDCPKPESKEDVESPNLLNQLKKFDEDEQSDNTIVTDIFSNYPRGSVKKNDLEQTMYVQREDPMVQKALSRLSRLQQLYRINLDHIETLLFGQDYKPHKNVIFKKLSSILASKLQLTEFQSQKFARFLVEEQNEQTQSEMVEFDPYKKINLGLVVIKIMASSHCPTIYNIQLDTEVHEIFIDLTKQKRKEFLDLIQKYKVDNVISHILFQNLVWQFFGKDNINLEHIECAYMSLCRIIPDSQDKQSNSKTKEEIMIKQCFQGFDAENLSSYLKKQVSKTNSSKNQIKTESISDSEELNNSYSPIKINILNTAPKIQIVQENDNLILQNRLGSGHSVRVKFQKQNAVMDDSSCAGGDSPNAPVTPILGGFDSKFPSGVGQSSAVNSGRLEAPGFNKKESPFDLNGDLKEDGQEFSFNENKSEKPDSSGETIFKTDSSYTKIDEKNSKSRDQEETKKVDLADNYSDSRSDTDFDMQQSLVRGQEQLNEFKKQRSQSSMKDDAKLGKYKYTGDEIQLIKEQQNDYSQSQNTELNTPVIVSDTEPSQFMTHDSPNSMAQYQKKLSYVSCVENEKLKSAQIIQEKSFGNQELMNELNNSQELSPPGTAVPLIEIVQEQKISLMGKSTKLIDMGALQPPASLQIDKVPTGSTNGVEGAEAPQTSQQSSQPDSKVQSTDQSLTLEFNIRRTRSPTEKKILFRNKQLVSFGQINNEQLQGCNIELVKKITMNKKNTILENIKTSLITIASNRQKQKQNLLFAYDNIAKTILLVGMKVKELQVTSLREFFKRQIFVLKENNKAEYEVIQPQELLDKLEALINGSIVKDFQDDEESLSFIDKSNILELFGNPQMSGMISYDEICEAFKHMELYDGRPANTEVLLLDKLDHKGMRIMKRFSNYLREQKQEISDLFFQDVSAPVFFKRLHELNIRRNKQEYKKILECLQVEEDSTIKLKSLQSLVSMFQEVDYFRFIGINKNNEDVGSPVSEEMPRTNTGLSAFKSNQQSSFELVISEQQEKQ